MKFSVCIGSIRPGPIRAAIDSVRCQTWTDWELIVVSQGDDVTLPTMIEMAAQQDPRVRHIHLQQRGSSIARNAGIQAATGEIIAILDDDCEARADWLETFAQYFRSEPDVGAVGGALIAPPRSAGHVLAVCPSIEPSEALYDPIASGRQPPPGWGWVSASFAVRRSVIERVGLFDEYLGPGTVFPIADDTDYLLRLEAHGIKTISTPRAVVYHTGGYRYGFQAVYRHARNYAYGNGALAAKLTLLGDPRGREWVAGNIREGTLGVLLSPYMYRLPISMLRLWYFLQAYQRCLREYRVDPGRGTLYPKGTDLTPLQIKQPRLHP